MKLKLIGLVVRDIVPDKRKYLHANYTPSTHTPTTVTIITTSITTTGTKA